ncbi:MAG: preprotein translocase subunit SecG [Gemmatales bacterium]|nr:preprotein translocase subunit SecG [Gemmatales bacterium]MDW8386265.1 preprotein translocase subunit SecG [Gemmatales bacterium]
MDVFAVILTVLIFLTGIVLIFLVLIQRGRGGGLAGMLGGAGGSSPFGSRAGDTFTRITLVVAVFWILLNVVQILYLQPPKQRQADQGPPAGVQQPSSE